MSRRAGRPSIFRWATCCASRVFPDALQSRDYEGDERSLCRLLSRRTPRPARTCVGRDRPRGADGAHRDRLRPRGGEGLRKGPASAAPVSPATARGQERMSQGSPSASSLPLADQGDKHAPAASCRRPACRRSCFPSCHRQQRAIFRPFRGCLFDQQGIEVVDGRRNQTRWASRHERARFLEPAAGASAHGLPPSPGL